ncbi:MAG: nitroreductase family protein [Candidatus Lokiarchaeia archaeon]
MDVLKAIKERRTIREFTEGVPSEEQILTMLESARLAPSSINRQPWTFGVVRDKEKIKNIAKVSQPYVENAPVIIVGVADYVKSPEWYPVDLGIALEHMVLTAQAQGLGTCWVGTFEEEEVKKILKIPSKDLTIVAMLLVGYPKTIPDPKPRKKLEEIAFRDEWNNPYSK